MTTYRKPRAARSYSAAAARAAWVVAALAVATAPRTSAMAMEQISFVYEEIEWNWMTRSKLEEDFRRAVAASQIKTSAAEIAGAAQAAFNSGVEHMDSWEQQTIIRGCGPARELCFVIVCNNCRGGK